MDKKDGSFAIDVAARRIAVSTGGRAGGKLERSITR